MQIEQYNPSKSPYSKGVHWPAIKVASNAIFRCHTAFTNSPSTGLLTFYGTIESRLCHKLTRYDTESEL